MKKLLGLLILLFSVGLVAEEPKLEELPDAPPPPDVVNSGEELEPDITIINKEKEVIEEYRINGRLYMIKVTPEVGPPYYLIDQDGDGIMETNADIDENIPVPQWVILSWD